MHQPTHSFVASTHRPRHFGYSWCRTFPLHPFSALHLLRVSLNLYMGQYPLSFNQISWRTQWWPGPKSSKQASSLVLIGLSMWTRGAPNRRGGTNQTHLLPYSPKGQSMTKGLLLWGEVRWRSPPEPSEAWVTTTLFDMGQAKEKTCRQI